MEYKCLNCEANLIVESDCEIGDVIDCEVCKTRMEILEKEPIVKLGLREDYKCLDCGELLVFDANCELGDIIDCEACGAEMEVIQKDPVIELRLFEEEK